MRFIKYLFPILLIFSTLSVSAQSYPIFNVECANGAIGDTVCIDVTAQNFNNIVSMDYAIVWNTSVLQYIGVGISFGIPEISASNFNYNTTLKKAFLSWSTNNSSGITVPSNTALYTLCFKVIGPIGSSTSVEIKGNTLPKPEITNAAGDDVGPNSTFNTCPINVTPSALTSLTIGIDKRTVAPNGHVCVPVTCENFKDIKNLVFKMKWDTAVVKLDSVGSMRAEFKNAVQIAQADGSFNFNWTGGPLTFPDKKLLFTLCFKAVGKPGTSSFVQILDSPVPTAVNANSNGQNIGINRKKGSVTINTTASFPLDSWISKTSGLPDQEVCLDVKVKNFKELVSMQYTIQWDPLALQFTKVSNFNLPSLDNAAFNINNSNDGNISVSWFVPNGLNVPDSTTIYQICFKPIGLTGVFPIEFTSNPIPIDVHSAIAGDDNIGLNGKAGSITVKSALLLVDTLLIMPTCKEPLGGKINLTINGGTQPYKYQWSSNAYNATTKDVSALAKGTFTVTVTDNATKPNKLVITLELDADIKRPKAKATVNGVISCTNPEVTLDGTGSDKGANISYEWITADGLVKTGKDKITATVVAAGTYAIKVTNTINGCSDTSQVLTIQTPDVPLAYAGPEQFIICSAAQQPITLDGTASSKGAKYTYKWTTTNGNITKNDTTLTPTVSKAGVYVLKVTNKQTGCVGISSVTINGAPDTPIASIEVKDTLNCNKKTLLINALNSTIGPAFTYSWSATQGGNLVNTSISPTVDKPGLYTLKISNTKGCVSTDSVRVYAFQDEVIALAGNTKIIGCLSNTVQLDGSKSTTGAAVIYKWTTQTGKIDLGDNTPNPTVSKAGSYSLTLTNKLSGCSSISKVTVVEDKAVPKADGGKDAAINCYQSLATLDAKLSSQGSKYAYDWTTVGGNFKSGQNTIAPKVDKAGKYYLVVRDTLNGCTAKDTVIVTEDKVTPLLTLTGETELNCKVKSITISVSPSKPANYGYTWTTKNGQLPTTIAKDSIKVTKPGTYNVVVFNKDNGCKDSISTSISEVSSELAKAGADLVECDDNTMLSANLPNGTTGIWTSTTNGALIASPNNNSTDVSKLIIGKNKLIWTLSSALCPNYSSDTVIVLVESKPTTNDDVVPLTFIDGYLTFNVSNNDKLTSIATWNLISITKPTFGNLDSTTVKGSLKYKPAAGFSGEQNFKYKICSKSCPQFCDTADVKLLIKNENVNKNLELPNIITPNGDGANDVLIFDILTFDPEKYKNNELVIFNRWGDIVFKAQPYTNNWSGNNSSGNALPDGTYYYVLRLNLGEGEVVKADVTIVR